MISCYMAAVPSESNIIYSAREEMDSAESCLSSSEHLIIFFYLFDFFICICALCRIIQ